MQRNVFLVLCDRKFLAIIKDFEHTIEGRDYIICMDGKTLVKVFHWRPERVFPEQIQHPI